MRSLYDDRVFLSPGTKKYANLIPGRYALIMSNEAQVDLTARDIGTLHARFPDSQ